MTPAERALRDAWLKELWPTCREVSIGDRLRKRKADREQRRELEERAVHIASTTAPELSTGNPESGCEDRSGNAA